jgi:hypothetical protein
MKRKLSGRLVLLSFLIPAFFACKKNTSFNGPANAKFDSDLTVQVYDEVRLSSEIDAAFNDIDNMLAGQAPCVTQVSVDTVDNPNSITIDYGGNSCDGTRSRGGVIIIYSVHGTNWSTAGDTDSTVFNNYTVTGIGTNKTVRLNGSFYYTNVSGGSLSGLTGEGASPVVHTIAGVNIGVTFDDGSTATWQVARQRTYTYSDGLVINTRGLDSAGGFANAAEWGGNRFGNSFVASVDSPLVITQACSWQLSGGQMRLSNPAGFTTVTYGLKGSGAPATGCPVSDSAYYMHVLWTGTAGNPYSALLLYSY